MTRHNSTARLTSSSGHYQPDEHGSIELGATRASPLLWQIAGALLIPVPASALALADQIIIGIGLTIAASTLAAILCGRASITFPGRGRLALIVDAAIFLAIGVISAIFISLLTFPEQGKLYRLSFGGYIGVNETIPSYFALIWAFSLATLPVSSLLTRSRLATHKNTFERRTAIVLASLGLIGLVLTLTVSRSEAFASRGESVGNGLVSMLYWAAATFVAYVVVGWRRHRQSHLYVVAALAATVLIAFSGNRSPLAFIAVAVVFRIVLDRRGRLLVIVGLCAPIGLAIFAYQSIWRSLVARGLPSGPDVIVTQIASDPARELLRVGVDSIEGHTLARVILERGFEARWADPFTAVLNFVPRQIWPDKPILLGSQIGESYLGLSAGGLFMSGPGYLALVTGSIALGSLIFVCFILVIKRVVCAERIHPLIGASLVFLAVRFTIAGDAFDIFLFVQVAFLFWIATLVGRALP